MLSLIVEDTSTRCDGWLLAPVAARRLLATSTLAVATRQGRMTPVVPQIHNAAAVLHAGEWAATYSQDPAPQLRSFPTRIAISPRWDDPPSHGEIVAFAA